MDFVAVLAREFSLRPEQVRAVIELLDAGNTVPFIARYRKEATGSLDDQLLRELTERLEYLRSLDKRRMEIEKSLAEQQVPDRTSCAQHWPPRPRWRIGGYLPPLPSQAPHARDHRP